MTDGTATAGARAVREDGRALLLGLSPEARRNGSMRWLGAAAFAVAVHAGAAAFLLASTRPDADGNPDQAIAVELMPVASEPSDKPDDVAGPKVAETGAATSENARADDPEPPAPDSPPPTETKRVPDTAPELTAPAAPTADALPPAPEPDRRPPEPKQEKPPEARPDEVDRRSAPSRASNGSVAQLEGGKRASPAAKATWAGAVGSHIARLRRYPKEARAEGWQGTARVRVTIDGNGHVTDRSIVKSSGRAILDEEALTLMQRSDPFPKPPTGMAVPVALTVPVNFAIR